MSHHYGRHGPHAWLRWRKRHFRRSMLPMLAQPEIRIIRVRIPIGIDAERVIYIIMANGEILGTSGEEPGDGSLFQPIPPSVPSLPPLPDTDRDDNDREIRDMAELRAEEDANTITYDVWIHRGELEKRAMRFAYEDMRRVQNWRRPLDQSMREDFRKKYSKAYSEKLFALTGLHIKAYIKDDREKALRELAIQDNNTPRTSISGDKVPYHKRDLGVLYIIKLIYGIDVDSVISDIENMHEWADRYTREFQKNTGSEVMWPPADFRERSNFF